MSEKNTISNVPNKSTYDNSRCIKSIRDRILLLCHGLQCIKYRKINDNCTFPYCDRIKNILEHMDKCTLGKDCPTDLCFSSRKTLHHWEHCKKEMNNCIICQPLKINKKPPVITINDDGPSVKLEPQLLENHIEEDNIKFRSQSPTSDRFTEIQAIPKEVIKKWHINVSPKFRARVIRRFIKQIFPAANAEAIADKRFLTIENYAKKVEALSYERANSQIEYHQIIADKVAIINKQLHDKQRKTKRLIRQFLNYKKNQNKATNSQQDQAVDLIMKTDNPGDSLSQKIVENQSAPTAMIFSPHSVTSDFKSQWGLGFLDEEWHQFVASDVREYFVYQMVHVLFPVVNVEILFDKRFHEVLAYAKKIENDVFIMAKSPSEYYHSLVEKLKPIEAPAFNY